ALPFLEVCACAENRALSRQQDDPDVLVAIQLLKSSTQFEAKSEIDRIALSRSVQLHRCNRTTALYDNCFVGHFQVASLLGNPRMRAFVSRPAAIPASNGSSDTL